MAAGVEDRPGVRPPVTGAPPCTGRPSPGQLLAIAAVVLLSAHTHLHRLGATTALLDELGYLRSGLDAWSGTVRVPAQPYLAQLLFGAAQLALGEGLESARAVSATASILTGMALVPLGRRLGGWWTGIGACALWAVLPHATRAPDGTTTMLKLGRSALLEPVMALFVVLAVLAGLRWATSGRGWDAIATGAALGAAVASKPTAALVAPVVVGGAVLALGATRRTLGQLVAVGAAAAVVVAASYAPLGGEAPAALRFLVEYQLSEHATTGHPVIAAGEVHPSAPWWAFAWWQWRSTGTAPLVALLVAGGAAVTCLRRDRTLLTVVAAAAVPFAALSGAARFGLPHYVHLWQPWLALLAAAGLTALAGRGRGARGLAAALALTFAVVGAGTVGAIAATEPRGYGALPPLVAGRDLSEVAVVVWGQALVAEAYLPGAEIVRVPAEATRPIAAVVVDPGTVARDPRPAVEAYLADAAGELGVHHVDHLVVHLRP